MIVLFSHVNQLRRTYKSKIRRIKEKDSPFSLYIFIGIEDFHRSRPYEPWSKSEIERLFKTVCDGFSRWFKSYTGTLTGSRTSAKIDKDIKQMLEQGKLLTMEEFYEKWSHYLHNVYAVKVHRGLKNQGETYCTPQELFDKGERYEKAAPS